MDVFSLVRAAASLAMLTLGLTAVFRVPHGVLWIPAVGATEWGHVLALFALCLTLPAWDSRLDQASVVAAVVAAVMLISPLVRAVPVASALPARMSAAFGDTPARQLPGAPARPKPLVASHLLRIASPEVAVSNHFYATEQGVQLMLDLYVRSDAPTPRPLVVVVHGGSWQSGDHTQLPGINRYLAARGYAVAAITYRLAPDHVFPAARDDVFTAVAWLRERHKELGLDPTRIVLMGRSAGAQLALSAAYEAGTDEFRGVVAYYPPTDMVWSWEHPTVPSILDSFGNLSAYLGGDPKSAASNFRNASPIHFVSRESPPTLTVHGGRDELVFPEQSRMLQVRLSEVGVRHLNLELPAATHGCDANLAGPSGQISTYAIERFLASVME